MMGSPLESFTVPEMVCVAFTVATTCGAGAAYATPALPNKHIATVAVAINLRFVTFFRSANLSIQDYS